MQNVKTNLIAKLLLGWCLLFWGSSAGAFDANGTVCAQVFKGLFKFEFEPLDIEAAQRIYREHEHREATQGELQIMELLHQIGSGEEGAQPGTIPGPENLTYSQKSRKYRGARKILGVKEATARALMAENVLGPKKNKRKKGKTKAQKAKEKRKLFKKLREGRKQPEQNDQVELSKEEVNQQFHKMLIEPAMRGEKITLNPILEFAQKHPEQIDWKKQTEHVKTYPVLLHGFTFLSSAMHAWSSREIMDLASRKGLSNSYKTMLQLILVSRREKSGEIQKFLETNMQWELEPLANFGGDSLEVIKYAYSNLEQREKHETEASDLAIAKLFASSNEARGQSYAMQEAVFQSRSMLRALVVTEQLDLVRLWIEQRGRTYEDYLYALEIMSAVIPPTEAADAVLHNYFGLYKLMAEKHPEIADHKHFVNFIGRTPIDRVPQEFHDSFFKYQSLENSVAHFLGAMNLRLLNSASKSTAIAILTDRVANAQKLHLHAGVIDLLGKAISTTKDQLVGPLLLEIELKSNPDNLASIETVVKSPFFQEAKDALAAYAKEVSPATALKAIQLFSESSHSGEAVAIFAPRAIPVELAKLFWVIHQRDYEASAQITGKPLLDFLMERNSLDPIIAALSKADLTKKHDFELADYLHQNQKLEGERAARLKENLKEARAQKKRVAAIKAVINKPSVQTKKRDRPMEKPSDKKERIAYKEDSATKDRKPFEDYSENELAALIKNTSYSQKIADEIIANLPNLNDAQQKSVYKLAYDIEGGVAMRDLDIKSLSEKNVYQFTFGKNPYRLMLGVSNQGLKMFLLDRFKSGSSKTDQTNAAIRIKKVISSAKREDERISK